MKADRLQLNDDQLDALQELLNISMGRAGSALARLLDEFVELSLPHIRLLDFSDLLAEVPALAAGNTGHVLVRQAFFGPLAGEVIAVYNAKGCAELAERMGFEPEMDGHASQELMLDVSNVLIGACLNCFAELTGVQLHFGAPSLAEGLDPHALGEESQDYPLLLMTIHMAIRSWSFQAELLIGMEPDKLEHLRQLIDSFMASI